MNLIWILISYLWSFLIFIFLTKPTEKTLSLYLYISQFFDLHCKLELIWILYMLPVPRSAYTFLRMPSETVMSLNQSILKYLSFFFCFCFFKQELLACLKAFCKSVAVFSLLIKKKKASLCIFIKYEWPSLSCAFLPWGLPAFPEGDPPPVWQLPRQADPQGLPGQIQPQEDEEVRTLVSRLTNSQT